MNLKDYIKTEAIAIGFDLVGVTTAEPVEIQHQQYFHQWLAENKAADMAYLHRHTEKRFDPKQLLPNAKSIICAAIRYSNGPADTNDYRIAAFALYEDYHTPVKKKAVFIG